MSISGSVDKEDLVLLPFVTTQMDLKYTLLRSVIQRKTNYCMIAKFWEIVEDRRAWYATIHGVTKELKVE